MWFLYTRLGQWLSRLLSGGWCFIRKDDPRFIVTPDGDALHYDGDPSAAPDRGIGNQRNAWKDWVIFAMPHASMFLFVVIDIYDGRRMACFKESPNGIFAIRAGHEPGMIRIGAWRSYYESPIGGAAFRPDFLARWREGEDPWPIGIAQDCISFI